MGSYILQKTDLSAYLKGLNDKFELYTPILEDGITLFRPYDGRDEIDCTKNTRVSVKSFFMPQQEVMFQYSTGSDEILLDQSLADTKRLVFGVNPCDARAIQLNGCLLINDESNPNKDVYFQKRLQNTILIGYGCSQPGTTCFCSAVGGDPFGHDGLDALVTDIGEQLLISLTGDGTSAKVLVENDLMTEATENDLTAAQKISQSARDTLALKPAFTQSTEDIKTLFDLSMWEETSFRCLNCGICTYLCPTCTCFDMIDQVHQECGSESRCWDSCMFSLFTQHASGHNPRSEKKERLRQRFLHKLYYFPERHGGDYGCVGCGRCVLNCPVNIDIQEIASELVQRGENCG